MEVSSTTNWDDLQPIPQNEPVDSVAAINYPEEYQEAMDLFRAVMQVDELSERALELTDTIINLNPAHYTAWWFRRKCLTALGSDLAAELQYVANIAMDNPKNYQIWYHRRAIVEQLGDSTKEIPFVDAVFAMDDGKNYHAWAHRQWVLTVYGGAWEAELEAVTDMIEADLRNNSAWNHRWFIIHNGERGLTGTLPRSIFDREVDYAMAAIRKAVHNESPWNYLRGLFLGVPFSQHPNLKMFCQDLLTTNGAKDCVQLHNLLAEILEAEGGEDGLGAALETLALLRDDIDIGRAKYWARRHHRVVQRLEQLVCNETA